MSPIENSSENYLYKLYTFRRKITNHPNLSIQPTSPTAPNQQKHENGQLLNQQ